MSELKTKPLWKRVALAVLQARAPVPGIIRPAIRVLYRLGVWIAEGFPSILKFIWIEPVMRSVCERVGKGFRAERLPYMRGNGHLSIGDYVHLSGRSCFYFMRNADVIPEILIGDHVFIGNSCTFSAAEQIRIGNHCLIGPGVRIHDNDGHPLDATKRRAGELIGSESIRPVIVETGVWLGAHATVLKGVRIGENSVVGTGAVVTVDVPANVVVAGNPARIVKALVPDVSASERYP